MIWRGTAICRGLSFFLGSAFAASSFLSWPVVRLQLIAMEAISARLSAADRLLAESADRPSHVALSALQRGAVIELIGQHQLSADERVKIADVVLKLKWHGEHGLHVLTALQQSAIAVPNSSMRKRRTLQDYEAMIHYFTQARWSMLTADSCNDVKLQIIVDQCIALGLRCPSEPTLKTMCSFWMLVSEANPNSIERHQKQILLKYTKSVFDKSRKNAADLETHVEKLPTSSAAFLREHPAIYKYCFAEGADPIPPLINLASLKMLNDLYTCRGSAPLASGRSQVDLTSSTVSNTVAQQMQQMLSFQQRVFEIATGVNHRALEHGVPRGSVPDLSSLRIRYPPLRSSSAEEFHGASPLAIMDSPQSARSMVSFSGPDASGTPQDAASLVVPTAVSAPPSDVVQQQTQGQPSAETPGVVKLGGVQEQLLKMLKERQQQNRNKSKKPQQEDEEEVQHKDDKTKDAIAMAGKPLATKRPAAATAAELPETKKATSAEKGLLLGCPKCRGCHTGCAKCRNPDYKGKRYQR